MASIRHPDNIGGLSLVFIVLYRLRALTDEEKRLWSREWADIKSHLPNGLKIVVEGFGAFGTPYTGFTIYEGTMENFRKHITCLEERSSSYVEKTCTIIGTKGFNLPLAGLQTILDQRPVD